MLAEAVSSHQRDGRDIVVFPDHMHEGNTLGAVLGYDYTQTVVIDSEQFVEFKAVAGNRELPRVIATGQSVAHSSKHADTQADVDPVTASPKTVNTLSVYDGRMAGVGRIVTGSTFHHYIDINLSGASNVNAPAIVALTGPGAAKGQGFGFAGAEQTFADIKAVFVNIAQWLARSRPAITLILERSTFSEDEVSAVTASPGTFHGAFS